MKWISHGKISLPTPSSVRVYSKACKPNIFLKLYNSLNYCCANSSKWYQLVFHYPQVLLTCSKMFHLQYMLNCHYFCGKVLHYSSWIAFQFYLEKNFSNSTWPKWFKLTSADDRDGVGGGEAGGILGPSFSPLVSGSGWTRTVAWVGLSSSSVGLTSGSSVGHRPISAFSKDTGWAKSMGLRTHKKSDVCY